VLIFCFKGTVSQDFLLHGFFHESYFSKPLKIRLGSFQTFSKLCSGIFASQGTPLVQQHRWEICHRCRLHRWQICTGINNTGGKFAEEGGPQISSTNLQICGLTKFVIFANLSQVWHLWICGPNIFCDLNSKFLCILKTSANLQILYFF
jgi:hypothetical protein